MNVSTGEKFLTDREGQSFVIAHRALERLADYTGFPATRAVAMAMFRRAYRVRSCELWPLGAWHANSSDQPRRRWYFRFRVFSQELIAVVSEGDTENTLEWTATYQLTGEGAHQPAETTEAVPA